MTKQEELTYLFDILSEASKWTASADDNRDLVRMEVEERIHNLINGIEPEPDENGLIQSSIHPDNPPAEDETLTGAEHLSNKNKAREKWKADKVRCHEDGKTVWHPACECHQEKLFPNNPKAKKFRWVWDGPKDKKVNKLSDELWEAHENGNDL